MQHAARFILAPLLAAAMTGGAWATENAKEPAQVTPQAAEYKRSDTNFYPEADVVKVHPLAVILPEGSFIRKGDSYFFTPHKKAPKEMYLETLNDWIEPITPPDMPASLGVPPDAMQIREPRGDVRVALPSAPANFAPVTDGMTLPNGAVVKTGANATAAVLFGGVDSARLMPNSAAAVQQTVTAQSRSAEVDLTTGGVFSKVGTQAGVKGEYEVHTRFGNAVAHGGDFVAIIASNRTDVWVAQGTVYLERPTGKEAETVTSEGTGALKLIRFPGIADPHQAMLADAETLTDILNFIPMANQKIKALRDKKANGATLTANEQDYLKRIKQVPCLIKLALLEPPAPAHTALIPVPPPAPSVTPAPPLPPVPVGLWPDGKIVLDGETISLDELKSRLTALAKANPAQPVRTVIIHYTAQSDGRNFVAEVRNKVTDAQLNKVLAICKALKLKVVVPKPPPPNAPNTQAVAPMPPNPVAPAAPAATTHAMPSPAPPRAAPVAPAVTEPTPPPVAAAPVVTVPANTDAPAYLKSITLRVRTDGKVDFQDAVLSLGELKPRLEAIAKTTPEQPFVIKVDKKVGYAQFKQVVGLFHDAGLQDYTLVMPAPPRAAPVATAPAIPSPAPPRAAPVATAPAIPSPAPPRATPVAPAVAEPTPPRAAPVATAPVPPSAGNLNHPVNVIAVHPDGTIKFRGVTMGLAEFQSKLKAAVKATPDQSFLIEAGTKVPYEKLKAVIDSCSDAQVKSVSVSIYAEGSVPEKTPPTAPANPATPATNPPPPAAAPATTAAPAPPAPPSPAGPAAIRAVVRVDGKINFQGLTYDLPGFKSKLEALMKATPDQAIVIKAGKTVPYEDFKAVLDICHAAQVKNLTVAAPAPTPGPVEPAVVKPAATNLPAPSLLMHPPADSMSSNAPPMSPSGLRAPTPSAPNTPAPANP